MKEMNFADTRKEEQEKILRYGERPIVTRKWINQLPRALRDVRYLVADFCGTLSAHSQWPYLKAALPEKVRREEAEDLKWYLDFVEGEHPDGTTLDNPDWLHGYPLDGNRGAIEGAFTARTLQRFIQAGITRQDVFNAAARIPLREGVHELFDRFKKHAVVSMGVEDVLRYVLDFNELPGAVAGTRLRYDAEDRICGYDPNLVVSATKRCALERFAHIVGADLSEIMVIGDSLIDVEMMPEKAVRVLVAPRRAESSTFEEDPALQSFRERHLDTMWKRVDIILRDESLLPLVRLIDHYRHAP